MVDRLKGGMPDKEDLDRAEKLKGKERKRERDGWKKAAYEAFIEIKDTREELIGRNFTRQTLELVLSFLVEEVDNWNRDFYEEPLPGETEQMAIYPSHVLVDGKNYYIGLVVGGESHEPYSLELQISAQKPKGIFWALDHVCLTKTNTHQVLVELFGGMEL